MLTFARFASLIAERYASSRFGGIAKPSEKNRSALRPASAPCAFIIAINGNNVDWPRR
jgi:hypothetical protein